MQREMCDPSEALPVIVEEFIAPMMRELEAVITHLEPRLPVRAVERCAFSVVGQALFYRFAMPAALRMLDLPGYGRGLVRELAQHISEFSLGGMERRAATRARSRHAR
jgi:hypothetical protein